jgi:hypothetical protein
MTRDRHGLKSPRLDHSHRHTAEPTARSEAHRAAPAWHRHAASKRVPAALSESSPNTDLPIGKASALSAEIIGVSHGIGLSVLWTVLRDHDRFSRTG